MTEILDWECTVSLHLLAEHLISSILNGTFFTDKSESLISWSNHHIDLSLIQSKGSRDVNTNYVF